MVTQTAEQQRGWLATQWLRFALAATFLTRLPLPVRGDVSTDDLRASMGWYPLLGLGLGAAGWGCYLGSSHVLPPAVAAALTIVLLEMCTGALHLDGFMDTCDGIGSGAPRERALEIMKDSRVGAMGVFGAVVVLLIKVTALLSLSPHQSLLPLFIGWAAARAVPALDVTFFRYARKKGTGGAFTEGKSPGMVACVIVSTLLIAWGVGQLTGVMVAGAVIVLTLSVQANIGRKLGGLTGDVYGMGVELAEVLALVAGCVLMR